MEKQKDNINNIYNIKFNYISFQIPCQDSSIQIITVKKI